jgi:hypothetical protein
VFGFRAHIPWAATDGPHRETSVIGPLGLERIADPSPKCSNPVPGRTRNALRMVRNQTMNLRNSAAHFFRGEHCTRAGDLGVLSALRHPASTAVVYRSIEAHGKRLSVSGNVELGTKL